MINFNNNNEEHIKVLSSTAPDILFSEKFQKFNFHLRKAFNDFFKENYKEITKVSEVTYSTNRVNYHFFKNEKNHDVRILRAENGCFSSNQKFVNLEFIESHKKMLEEERDLYVKKLPPEKIQDTVEWCNNKINSVAKVLTTYEQLTNITTPKPKM